MKENMLAHGKICWEITTDWKYICTWKNLLGNNN
jgi:hypothetical protein